MRRDPAVDEYLAGVTPSSSAQLRKLRKTIHSIVPEVEECISYRLPATRHRGKIIAGFSANSTACSYHPFSGTALKTLAGDIEGTARPKALFTSVPKSHCRRRLFGSFSTRGWRRANASNRSASWVHASWFFGLHGGSPPPRLLTSSRAVPSAPRHLSGAGSRQAVAPRCAG